MAVKNLSTRVINILNGHRAYDYIAKYERIRTQTPLMIKEEKKETKKKEEEDEE